MNPVMKARGVSYSPVSKCRGVLHPRALTRPPWHLLSSASDRQEALGSQPDGILRPSRDYDYWRHPGTILCGHTSFRACGRRRRSLHRDGVRSWSARTGRIVQPLPASGLCDPPFRLRGPLVDGRHLCRPRNRTLPVRFPIWSMRRRRAPPPNGDALPARSSRTVPAAVLSSPRFPTSRARRRPPPRLARPPSVHPWKAIRPAGTRYAGRSRVTGR